MSNKKTTTITPTPTPIAREQLLKRGYCCSLKCQNCPYDPKHTLGVTKVLSINIKATTI